jgi:GntR family transcriptional repressor for pyruvate dehydrogenase complex
MNRPGPTLQERKLAMFRPIRVRSASDEVLAVLADAIRGGLFAPGEPLPRERDLAEQLAVSRTVVREAVAALRQAGVVTVRRGHGGGIVIASLSNLPQVLSRIAGETRVELHAVLEVRRALETQTAPLSSQRATEADFERLESLVEELPALAGLDQEFYEADVRFHLAVADASGNPLLAELVRDVFNRLAVLREPFPHAHVDFMSAINNQRELLRAIRRGQPGRVAAAMDKHLAAFERVMLGRVLEAVPGRRSSDNNEETYVQDGIHSRPGI